MKTKNFHRASAPALAVKKVLDDYQKSWFSPFSNICKRCGSRSRGTGEEGKVEESEPKSEPGSESGSNYFPRLQLHLQRTSLSGSDSNCDSPEKCSALELLNSTLALDFWY